MRNQMIGWKNGKLRATCGKNIVGECGDVLPEMVETTATLEKVQKLCKDREEKIFGTWMNLVAFQSFTRKGFSQEGCTSKRRERIQKE